VRDKASIFPSRKTLIVTRFLGAVRPTASRSAFWSGILRPSNSTITSPRRTPAASAGEPGRTLLTRTPLPPATPNWRARTSSKGMTSTPIQPRTTRPFWMSWSMTSLARLEGMANPIPAKTPVGA